MTRDMECGDVSPHSDAVTERTNMYLSRFRVFVFIPHV